MPRRGLRALADRVGLGLEACAAGVLEISAWNQANALRQVTVRRGLDIRDYPMVTFGGSGSLLACRLMDILGLPTVLVPPNPGTVSAFGLLTVDVRDDYVRTSVGRHDSLDLAARRDDLRRADRSGAGGVAGGGVSGPRSRSSNAPRTCATSARRTRYRLPARLARSAPDWADRVADGFHQAHRALYGYDFRGNAAQQVEWVNLRVTGIGPIPRPEISEIGPSAGGAAAAVVERPAGVLRELVRECHLRQVFAGIAVTWSSGRRWCRNSVRRFRSIRGSSAPSIGSAIC